MPHMFKCTVLAGGTLCVCGGGLVRVHQRLSKVGNRQVLASWDVGGAWDFKGKGVLGRAEMVKSRSPGELGFPEQIQCSRTFLRR